MNKVRIVSIVALIFLLIGALTLGYAVYFETLQISSNGSVITPAQLSSVPDSITWGDITQGTSIQAIVKVTNNGQTDTGTLSITHNTPTGLTLTWNTTASILAGETRAILFTLSAANDAQVGLFDITINIGPTT